MIKGFLFDLDGVITETDEFHYLAWKKEISKIGINYTKQDNSLFKGLPREETLRAILKHYKINNINEKDIRLMSSAKNLNYVKMLNENLTRKNILPGIINFIKKAKENNMKMAITSSSHNAPLILKKLDLYKYFEYIVDPKIVKNGKPAPDIYLLGAKGLKIEPKYLIGLEDAIPGIEGLYKAKIRSIAITHLCSGDWSKANLILETTRKLIFKKVIDFF